MNTIALIPARLASTRLPRKLLLELDGKTIIRRTYEAVVATALFDAVYVVCDDALLFNEITQHGGQALMSSPHHESGTDRIAEAAQQLNADIIVNVQGDEPFIEKQALQHVINLFQHPDADITSLKTRLHTADDINNPNFVKVVCNEQGKALFFSRSPIPYVREQQPDTVHFKHIGVYAYRREALLKLAATPPTMLERTEKLENLRMLEAGFTLYLAEVDSVGLAIDTEADFEKARRYLSSCWAPFILRVPSYNSYCTKRASILPLYNFIFREVRKPTEFNASKFPVIIHAFEPG